MIAFGSGVYLTVVIVTAASGLLGLAGDLILSWSKQELKKMKLEKEEK